jgi:diguanylate cyclase
MNSGANELTIHTPTLVGVSVIVMLSLALIAIVFGTTQRTYRGYWWWAGAMWLAPLGSSLLAVREVWAGAAVPGVMLMMAWPFSIVQGLRQFYVRDAQLSSPVVDGMVYAVCFGAWLLAFAAAMPIDVRAAAYVGSALLLHGYVALVIARFGRDSRSAAPKMLAGVIAVLGAIPVARLIWVQSVADASVATHPLLTLGIVLPLSIGMLCIAYLCLVLTHERTVHDLHETQRQLRVLADIDMLTQVPNRRRVEELAERMVGKMGDKPTVLMMFDIDHFKRINDTHGHASGDEALRVVARCARETLRTRDVLGRIGGDEFMLLLPGATVDHALQIADRITRRLDAQRKATRLPLSLSFGVVQIESGETIESARRRADAALYEAKRQGRRRAVPAELHGRNTVFGESRALGLDPLQPV